MDEEYREKYLKYKAKYNKLKKAAKALLKNKNKALKNPKMVQAFNVLKSKNMAGQLEKIKPMQQIVSSMVPQAPSLVKTMVPQVGTLVQRLPINYAIGVNPVLLMSGLSLASPLKASESPKPIYPLKKYQIVYGVFNKEMGAKLNLIKPSMTINDAFVDKTFMKTISEPHTSIVYEPEYIIPSEGDYDKIVSSIPVYKTIDDLDNEKMYPGFKDFLKSFDKIDDLVLEGVSAFFRENRVIIKVTFNSDKMNSIREFLYKIPSMQKYKEAWVEKLNKIAPMLRTKYGTSKYFKPDETFAEPPSGWIHHTLVVVKGDTPVAEIDKLIENGNQKLFELGFVKGQKYSIDQLKLRTHDMSHFEIWKTT